MVNAAHQDFIANAIALKPTIRQYREELDSGNRLPPELARQLNEAGLFQLALPRSMGGPESDPLTSFRVIEELSRVDGSVGWCAMLSSSCSLFAGWLTADVGRAMFGQPPDFRMAGSIRPQGEALVVDGGYRLRGQWDYASGVHHANWLLCTCKLVDANGPLTNPDGTPQIRTLLAPAEAAVLHDTWAVVGLRATGSHDFELTDVFVPEEHSYALFNPAHEQGPLYHPRFTLVAAWTPIAGNTLGMARGAMDAFIELATGAGTTMSDTHLRDRPIVQTKVAEAEAMIGSARAYVFDAVGAAWDAVCAGNPDPGPEIARARLAVTNAMRESVKAIDLLFHAAGTNAIHRRHPLERFFRDVHVAVQHVSGLPSNFDSAGQALLGVRPSDPGW